jgi:hypothetical protein
VVTVDHRIHSTPSSKGWCCKYKDMQKLKEVEMAYFFLILLGNITRATEFKGSIFVLEGLVEKN